jgi:hypothetical protein
VPVGIVGIDGIGVAAGVDTVELALLVVVVVVVVPLALFAVLEQPAKRAAARPRARVAFKVFKGSPPQIVKRRAPSERWRTSWSN